MVKCIQSDHRFVSCPPCQGLLIYVLHICSYPQFAHPGWGVGKTWMLRIHVFPTNLFAPSPGKGDGSGGAQKCYTRSRSMAGILRLAFVSYSANPGLRATISAYSRSRSGPSVTGVARARNFS